MTNSVQPQRRQPTRLPRPWDSPDKNTGVDCHFLLQPLKVKSESEVAQLCSTLRDPMDCSLPRSSIYGIFQARVLENPMDGGAWKAAVHGVSEGQTQLSDFTFTFHFHALEKEMATHSSILAWRIPGTEEPGGAVSMGSHRVGHD